MKVFPWQKGGGSGPPTPHPTPLFHKAMAPRRACIITCGQLVGHGRVSGREGDGRLAAKWSRGSSPSSRSWPQMGCWRGRCAALSVSGSGHMISERLPAGSGHPLLVMAMGSSLALTRRTGDHRAQWRGEELNNKSFEFQVTRWRRWSRHRRKRKPLQATFFFSFFFIQRSLDFFFFSWSEIYIHNVWFPLTLSAFAPALCGNYMTRFLKMFVTYISYTFTRNFSVADVLIKFVIWYTTFWILMEELGMVNSDGRRFDWPLNHCPYFKLGESILPQVWKRKRPIKSRVRQFGLQL